VEVLPAIEAVQQNLLLKALPDVVQPVKAVYLQVAELQLLKAEVLHQVAAHQKSEIVAVAAVLAAIPDPPSSIREMISQQELKLLRA
jgi:hypothetical protein